MKVKPTRLRQRLLLHLNKEILTIMTKKTPAIVRGFVYCTSPHSQRGDVSIAISRKVLIAYILSTPTIYKLEFAFLSYRLLTEDHPSI